MKRWMGIAGFLMLLMPGAFMWAQASIPVPASAPAFMPISSAPMSSMPMSRMVEIGQRMIAGIAVPYQIRRLPVSSFPELPAGIAAILERRGCMIPQTYAAHRPENVIHASLELAGSVDWAVLCSAEGRDGTEAIVCLLVFFASAPDEPILLASATEKSRLQVHDTSGVLGFNWGIDPATPERVHEAQAGMEHRSAQLSHDALADTVLEHTTVYHVHDAGGWRLVETAE